MSIGSGNPRNDILARFRQAMEGIQGLDKLDKFEEFMKDPVNIRSMKAIASYIERCVKGSKYRGFSLSNADCSVQMDFTLGSRYSNLFGIYIDFEEEKFVVSGGYYTDFGTWDEEFHEISSNWEKLKLNKLGIETVKVCEKISKQYKMMEEESMDLIGKVIRVNEDYCPVVSEGKNRVVCVGSSGDKFVIDKQDLVQNMFESEGLFEAASLSVVSKGVDKDGLLLVVNGKNYHYTSDSYTPKQLEDKFVGIAKHSVGKAYTWIKGNAKAKESYKKVKDSPKVDVPSASSYVNGVIKGLKKFPDKYSVKVGGEDLVFKVEKYVEVWGDSSYTGHLDLSPIDKSAIKRSAGKWISGGRTKKRDVGSFVDTLLDGLSKEIVKSDSERKIKTGFWNPSEYKTIDDLEGITHRAYFTNMAYDRSCPSSYKYFGSDTKKFYDYIKPELDKAGIKTVLRK